MVLGMKARKRRGNEENGWGDECGSKEGEGKTPYFQEEGRYSTFTGLHDSFYHGPICHYIDNCLGTSAGHTMSFRIWI